MVEFTGSVAALTAIDVHVHAEVSSQGGSSLSGELEQAADAYFKIAETRRPTLPEIAAYYREPADGLRGVHRGRRGGHRPAAGAERGGRARRPPPTRT